MIKAIVFDMDGVLIDSEQHYQNRTKEYLNHLGIDVDRNKLNKLAGGSKNHYDAFMNDLFIGTNLTIEDFDDGYTEYYKNEKVDLNKILFDGVRDILPYIKAQGFRIALASSSQLCYIEEMLDTCHLREYFEAIMSGEMFHESKPNPEIYLTMADHLGLLPSECIAIEDSTYGLTSAHNAGYYVVGKRDDRFGYNQSIADVLFDDFNELKNILSDFVDK
ncbi:MAG: HAD family phosphatase [Erysipelotrichaceae bacterium]